MIELPLEWLQTFLFAIVISTASLVGTFLGTRRWSREVTEQPYDLNSENRDSMLVDIRKRNRDLERLLDHDELWIEMERNLVLEITIWSELNERREKLGDLSDSELDEHLARLSFEAQQRSKILNLFRKFGSKFAEKAVDKLVGILNGMIGIPKGKTD